MKKKPFFSRPSKEVAISYLNRQAFVLASACTLPIAVLIYLIKKVTKLIYTIRFFIPIKKCSSNNMIM
jgi:hypothetical protein